MIGASGSNPAQIAFKIPSRLQPTSYPPQWLWSQGVHWCRCFLLHVFPSGTLIFSYTSKTCCKVNRPLYVCIWSRDLWDCNFLEGKDKVGFTLTFAPRPDSTIQVQSTKPACLSPPVSSLCCPFTHCCPKTMTLVALWVIRHTEGTHVNLYNVKSYINSCNK